MVASVIGALRVNLSADTAEFRRNLTDAERIAERFGNSIGSSIRRQVLALGAALTAVAGPAALGLLTKASIENVSAQVDLARRVGGSVAAIQTLGEAAKLSGASQEALSKTLGTLNQRLGQAAREGAGPAYEALQRLGLSARALSEMDADQRIKTLSDRMVELGYSTQQQADTLRDLGVKQQEIINLFIEGGAAIEETRKNLKDWGVLLSNVDAAKVEAAGDAIDKIGTIATGVGNQLAVSLSPIIQEVAEYLGDAAAEGGGFGTAIDKAVSMGVHLFAGLQREIYDVRITFDSAIGTFLDGFNKVAEFPAGLLAKVFGGSAEDYGFAPIKHSFGTLIDTLEKPLSTEGVDIWLAEVRAKADEAAKVVAGTMGPGTGADDDEGQTEKQAKDIARYREQMAEKLLALQESLLSEREAEIASYEQSQLLLEDALAAKLLTNEEYAADLVSLNQQHAQKLKAIDDDIARNNERNAAKQRDVMFGIADDISSALGSLFGESKAWAIAEAIINTATAVTKALAIYGPTPQGFAAAAAGVAAGAAQLMAIRRTSNKGGGSGGTPSVSGGSSSAGGGAAPAQTASPAAPGQTLSISGISPGQIFTGEALRALFEQIIEAQRDGAKIVLEPT